MQYLTLDEAIVIHEEIIRVHGGASTAVRDLVLLDSALAMPQQAVFGSELYPSIADKAGILLYLLIQNHPFVDGNKRTALIATLRFIESNDYTLTLTNDEAVILCIEIASGKLNKEAVTAFLSPRITQKES